jgi:hypothetical protein
MNAIRLVAAAAVVAFAFAPAALTQSKSNHDKPQRETQKLSPAFYE